MSTTTRARTVVLAGNPNVGKTTLFNRLTGGRARVGNYPGVTVERHLGRLSLPDLTAAELIDSPGTYSLSARTLDEQVAFATISGLAPGDRPDLVVVVVDAARLSRNLYLVLQVLELGLPVVVALNMVDEARRSGLEPDVPALERELGVPVVPVVARKGEGTDALLRAVAAVLHDPARGTRDRELWTPEPALAADVAAVAEALPAEWHGGDERRRDALALWALLSLDPDDELIEIPPVLRDAVESRRARATADGRTIDREVIAARYAWIDARVTETVRDRRRVRRWTDRLDRFLLHPVLGFAFFLLLMTGLFQALFAGADPVIGRIEDGLGWLSARAADALPGGLFADFVVDGLIGGVGAFLVFLPQIVILFLFLGLLEDSGYMARVAVLMDRIMKALGLHGRAFVPMLSGFACAVPAILATRNMERQRDRLLTMMVLPLMTCSARLPVYGLLIAAIVPIGEPGAPFRQGLLLAGMYVFGTVTALVCAFVLGRTLIRGPRIPLVLEMPPYRLPHAPTVLRTVTEQASEFVKKAGTVILLCSIAMWVLLEFPRHEPEGTGETETAAAAAQASESYAGQLGRALEPVLEPLGFDWRIGVGIVGAFAAREVFVSTMGVVYGVGADVDEETPALRERLAAATWPDGRLLFTPLVCLSLMVFFALACQCMSTLAVVRRETRTWRWPVFMLAYMTVLAWGASFAVFQGGRLLGFA